MDSHITPFFNICKRGQDIKYVYCSRGGGLISVFIEKKTDLQFDSHRNIFTSISLTYPFRLIFCFKHNIPTK